LVYPAATIFFKIYDHKFAGKARRFYYFVRMPVSSLQMLPLFLH